MIDLVGLHTWPARGSADSPSAWVSDLVWQPRCWATPQTVALDEPANGLDPEGVLWMRTMLKKLAADGHTVFVSSHLMSEMAQTATRLVVIGKGRLIADTTVDGIRRPRLDQYRHRPHA